jgi:hypothetical protein
MEENTDYKLSISVNEGIVEIVITGELTKKTLDRLHAEVITIIRDKDAKAVLCDVRSATGPNEIIEAYFRARSIPSDVMILPSAVVDRSENWSYKSFYETTAANTGQLMKYFTDVEAARAWLKSRLEEMRRK